MAQIPKRGSRHKAKAERIGTTRPAWFVGAAYGGTDDRAAEFVTRGIWHNGYRDKYNELVLSMLPGDRIAIKASYTRKHGLPFDAGGEFVSVLGIKAVGTVISNDGDGQTVRVRWAEAGPIREWYFFTSRATVWCVEPGDWRADGLIAFTFQNEPQDFERFRKA
jgi:5-methylcytosine-specific restriction enzyme B